MFYVLFKLLPGRVTMLKVILAYYYGLLEAVVSKGHWVIINVAPWTMLLQMLKDLFIFSLQLIHVLYTMNLSLAEGSKLYFLGSLGDMANNELIKMLQSGYGCKVTVDNIDWRMIYIFVWCAPT